VRRIYAVLAGLMLLAVLAQFYFAAVGAFDKPHEDSSFALHSMTGMIIIVLSLLTTIAAAVSRAPGRLIGLTSLPLGLTVVQMLIIALGSVLDDSAGNTTPGSLAILGLHAINGLAIMAVSGMVFRQARLFATGTAPSETASVA
jgi:cytochrome b561